MKKLAFTLAEILITLGIIGIVAALTIPTVLSNYQDKATIVQLKKDYNIITQAFNSIKVDNGELQDWCPYNQYSTQIDASTCAANLFSKYLRIEKYCGPNAGCIPAIGYKSLYDDGTYSTSLSNNIYQKMMLSDGSTLIVEGQPDATLGGIHLLDLIVDINGLKAPNRWGYDVFEFMAFSANENPIWPRKLTPWHYDTNGTLKTHGCDNSVAWNGSGCASWAIFNENLDYKYVNDLNWQTKTHK